VIFTSPLVGLLKLSDKFTTGSSIMPQKRNPDAAELVRAKAGRIVGALTGLMTIMKGLPLAYQKDMQEDKPGAIEALAALGLSLSAMTGMVTDLQPDEERMKQAAAAGYATATDLADWLVRHLKLPFRDAHRITGQIVAAAGDGYATATDLADWLTRALDMPFRDAHHTTGRIVAKAAEAGVPLDKLPLSAMQAIEPRITKAVFAVLTAEASAKSRTVYGGTAPKNVRVQAKRWLKRLKKPA